MGLVEFILCFQIPGILEMPGISPSLQNQTLNYPFVHFTLNKLMIILSSRKLRQNHIWLRQRSPSQANIISIA
ncbi:hypothetical protein AY599_15340 [Leptolyngbya valderiana BDU 20041]|nr:hypothetical protein AY599_15340 [Leptolyngbya valderiana BDU 20041]